MASPRWINPKVGGFIAFQPLAAPSRAVGVNAVAPRLQLYTACDISVGAALSAMLHCLSCFESIEMLADCHGSSAKSISCPKVARGRVSAHSRKGSRSAFPDERESSRVKYLAMKLKRMLGVRASVCFQRWGIASRTRCSLKSCTTPPANKS